MVVGWVIGGLVVKLVVVLMVVAGLGGVLVGCGVGGYELIVGDGVLGGGLLLELLFSKEY